MRHLAFAALIVLAAAQAGADDLVAASKAAKAKKKSSTTKVITNADVKKSKGKLVEHSAPAKAVEAAPAESTMERYERERRTRVQLEAQLATASTLVADLEKRLAEIEQQYYDENDLDKRDRDIVKRFNEVKQQLDDARATRDALTQQLNPSTAQ